MGNKLTKEQALDQRNSAADRLMELAEEIGLLSFGSLGALEYLSKDYDRSWRCIAGSKVLHSGTLESCIDFIYNKTKE